MRRKFFRQILGTHLCCGDTFYMSILLRVYKVCACVNTYTHEPTLILLGGWFLFTPFPPLFTRGYSRHLLSSLSLSLTLPRLFPIFFSSGIENSHGNGAQGRIKRPRHPCSVWQSLLFSRGPVNEISGQSKWQMKFSPGCDSTAPLNLPVLKPSLAKRFRR